MDEGLHCPACGAESPAFRAMSDAVLAVTAELSVGPILQKIVDAARQLVQARYAALGVPDGEGGFARFVVAGITEKQFDAIGELPRTHGLLGAMLEDPAPFRVPDITEDPRFEGWPPAHPNMRSFLGVPIVSKGEIIGAFYLTDKKGGRRAVFSDVDQQLIQTLAAHAAIAIENARLYERSRELSIVEERNRLARELHDAVNQTLFSIALTADASALLVEDEPRRAREQMTTVRQLARDAMEEMRSLIFELRPAELGADGLVPTLRKHVEVLRRVHGAEIELDVEGGRPLEAALEREVFRIAQEALTNALKHARAGRLEVRMDFPDQRLRLCVSDDGVGFDPDGPSARGKLGLVSMRERAQAVGGDLHVESRPGAGTTLRLEVELD